MFVFDTDAEYVRQTYTHNVMHNIHSVNEVVN